MTITDDAPLYAKDVSSILYDRTGCYATSSFTVSDSVVTTITWSSLINHDPLQMAGNDGKQTIAVPSDGLWSITATSTGGAVAARSLITIFLGPYSQDVRKYFNSGEDKITVSGVFPLDAGSEFLVQVYYDLSVASASATANLHVYKVGP